MSYFGLGMGLGGPPALVRGPHIAGAGLLPELVDYRDTTGATDLSGLNILAGYLLDQSLYNDTMFASFKAAQNYGSGSAAATLGGAQAHDWTLINGPAWQSGGVLMGPGEFMRMPDYMGGAVNLTVFLRATRTISGVDRGMISQYDFGNNQRRFSFNQIASGGGRWGFNKSSNGTDLDTPNGGSNNSGVDSVFALEFEQGLAALKFWINNTPQTITDAGSITSLHNSTADLAIGARLNDGAANITGGNLLASAALTLEGPLLTTAQRETISTFLLGL